MDSVVTEVNSGAVVDDDLRLDAIAEKPLEFNAWTSLISHVEKLYADDEEKICAVYDSFLSNFPLCYGYWRKYAAHRIRLGTFDKIIKVFERAVLAVAYCVDVWVDYCAFCMSLFPDPNDVRRQFKRGLSHVGRDYLCHILWDKYIEFEFSQQNWSALAYIYIQILRYPKKMLRDYYERFTQLATMFKEEMERQGTFVTEISSVVANESPAVYMDDEILGILKDLLDESDKLSKSKAWQKYKLIGESLHRKSCLLDEKIHCFEIQIHRTYFHIQPLNELELENWHQYLDFVEEQGDFDWAVKLYERCLIPCALYTDFWIRYTQFLENKGGRELANFALDRGTKVFLKTVPSIHLFNARYKEQTRDFYGARESFPKRNPEELDSKFISNVMEQANMERRLGNYDAAYRVYREAIELTTERKKLDMLSCLYIHYSRLAYKATNSVGAALGILADGIKQTSYCRLLLEELIKFGMMHGGPEGINAVDSTVANALASKESQSLSSEEKESISLFFLEFVDLCGTIDDLMKAWVRHIKLFPHSVRTLFNGEPHNGRKSAEVAALKAKDFCLDVDPSTCSASRLDKPVQLPLENLAGDPTADSSPQNINNTDPIEDEHGIELNLNSLRLGGIDTSSEDKGSPNATTNDCRGLEDLPRNKTPDSVQDQHLSEETRVGGSSDSGHGIRGNPATDDQRFVQRSVSPAGTPRSVSSYVPKSSEDPPSTSNENSTQSLQVNTETGRDWHLRRRYERFIKDPHSRHRPQRQGHFRSESDHIITIQRNAAQPLPMKTQPVQDNQAQHQQPWVMSSQFNPALAYSWPVQNMHQNIASASQSQPPAQTVEQVSAQMPQYSVQASNLQMQNQQAYDQMMQYYYYQQQQFPQQWQQAPDQCQQQQFPQQWQQAPDQCQQQQQQQYWLQLQYQQQLAQAPTQQLTQAPLQQLAQGPTQQLTQAPLQQLAQVPMHMQQQAQMPMQQQQAQMPMQQQQAQQEIHAPPQPGSQAPLLHQQQLQQLLELQQLRKQQQEHQQLQTQQEKVQIQRQPTPSSPEISV